MNVVKQVHLPFQVTAEQWTELTFIVESLLLVPILWGGGVRGVNGKVLIV